MITTMSDCVKETIIVFNRVEISYATNLRYVPPDAPNDSNWRATVWVGDMYYGSWYGATREDARKEALIYIYDTFDTPSNLDSLNIEYHEPEELYE